MAYNGGERVAQEQGLLSWRLPVWLHLVSYRVSHADLLVPVLPAFACSRRSYTGASSVGKSSLLLRFTDETFLSPDETSGRWACLCFGSCEAKASDLVS